MPAIRRATGNSFSTLEPNSAWPREDTSSRIAAGSATGRRVTSPPASRLWFNRRAWSGGSPLGQDLLHFAHRRKLLPALHPSTRTIWRTPTLPGVSPSSISTPTWCSTTCWREWGALGRKRLRLVLVPLRCREENQPAAANTLDIDPA